MNWTKFISNYARLAILTAFPQISARLPNAWISGERTPPEYAQESLAFRLIMSDEEVAVFRERLMADGGFLPCDLSYVDELERTAEALRTEQGAAAQRESVGKAD